MSIGLRMRKEGKEKAATGQFSWKGRGKVRLMTGGCRQFEEWRGKKKRGTVRTGRRGGIRQTVSRVTQNSVKVRAPLSQVR